MMKTGIKLNRDTLIEILCLLLREPLLKKGLLSNSLPKTFVLFFHR
ncbi:hypothetical protein SAMN02910280_0016 [Ruminococcus flavefaciens]|uniref:Uncharacterized protein n=1 Tax=Ruminococcus flavefaciens TaxID=1265 RepID=A0A1K1PPM7_RUMFL|nr:hypothetical protein SAMN02910280_0016 [Ruminococcus flavefaciens]